MHNILKALHLLDINFHLFGEGGEGSEAGEGTQGETNASQNSTLSDNSGDFSNIVFGKPAPGEEAADTSTPAAEEEASYDDLNAEFHELVNGKYKQQYTDATQKMINKRFAESKQNEARMADMGAVCDEYFEDYPDVEYGDYKGLLNAIKNDENRNARKAEEEGFTEEQYSEVKNLRDRNKQLNREKQDFERWRENNQKAEYAKSVTAKWQKEANDLKSEFPDFNFNEEVQNKDFVSMLKLGMPLRKCYLANHGDEIMKSKIAQTSKNTAKQITDDIRARGTQPLEAAATSGSNFKRMSDPSTWTDAMLEEVARQVEEEGANIYL